MSEVLHPNILQIVGPELLAIASERHVTGDGAEGDEDQKANNQETLDDNDDDANDSRYDPIWH